VENLAREWRANGAPCQFLRPHNRTGVFEADARRAMTDARRTRAKFSTGEVFA
jgi:hypothetical protein